VFFFCSVLLLRLADRRSVIIKVVMSRRKHRSELVKFHCIICNRNIHNNGMCVFMEYTHTFLPNQTANARIAYVATACALVPLCLPGRLISGKQCYYFHYCYTTIFTTLITTITTILLLILLLLVLLLLLLLLILLLLLLLLVVVVVVVV
jgi:hypothetical protein